jgi:colicin import membrane protein
MQDRRDNLRAIGKAIGLHLLLLGFLFVGLLFQRSPQPLSVAGGTIEAVLTDTLAAPPPAPRPAAAPPSRPQPRPEPRPQDAVQPPQPTPQAPVAKPDAVDQARVVREAAQKAEDARREQEERRRQEQVLLEEKQQQEEAERRQRLAQQQAERDKQLADIRRQREDAEKRRRLEEEKLKQISDMRQQAEASSAPASTAPPSDRLGNQGTDDGLLGRYQLAIQQQVDRNWLRPDSLRPGLRCYVGVTQMVGGQVSGLDFARCPADDITRRSIEAALMREALPYRGYESVFQRKLNIPFCYPVEVCVR